MKTRRSARALATAILLVCVAGSAAATDCIDYTLTGLGNLISVDPSLRVSAMVAHDGLHYAIVPGDGLVVLDLSAPGAPVRIGSAPLACAMETIAVADGLAFLAGSTCGGRVYDIADPAHPAVIGTIPADYPITDLAAWGTQLFAVEAWADYPHPDVVLHAFDTSDPTSVVGVAFTDTVPDLIGFGRQAALATRDGVLWFAAGASTRYYDISKPGLPVLRGQSLAMNLGIAFDGDLAVGASATGVTALNATSPLSPSYVGSYFIDYPEVYCLATGSGYIALGRDNQVHVLDVSLTDGVSFRGLEILPAGTVATLAVAGEIWIGGGNGGFWQLGPGLRSPVTPDWEFSFLGRAADLVLVGDMVHAVTEVGLETWDISDPASPTHTSTVFGLGASPGSGGIAHDGDVLMVAKIGLGVVFLTGAGTASPVQGGTVPLAWCASVGVNDGLAWALDNQYLVGMDYADPANPQVLRTFTGPSSTSRIAVGGDRAIAVNDGYAPWIIDISDPTSLTYAARLVGSGPTVDASVAGGRACVATADGLVMVWDVTNPLVPVLLGGDDLSSFAPPLRVDMLGRYIYAGLADGTLVILDTPDIPDIGGAGEFSVLEVVPRANPWPIDAMDIGPDSWLVSGGNGLVRRFAAQCGASALAAPELGVVEQNDLRVFHWVTPEQPEYVETCLYRGDRSGFEPVDPIGCSTLGYVVEDFQGRGYYVARHRDAGGLWTLPSNEIVVPAASDVPERDRNLVVTVGPNPFNPAVTVRVQSARPGRFAVEVYDLRGRRVAVLHEGRLDPGPHAFRWAGRDTRGRAMPSGGYVIRVAGPAEVVTRSVVLFK